MTAQYNKDYSARRKDSALTNQGISGSAVDIMADAEIELGEMPDEEFARLEEFVHNYIDSQATTSTSTYSSPYSSFDDSSSVSSSGSSTSINSYSDDSSSALPSRSSVSRDSSTVRSVSFRSPRPSRKNAVDMSIIAQHIQPTHKITTAKSSVAQKMKPRFILPARVQLSTADLMEEMGNVMQSDSFGPSPSAEQLNEMNRAGRAPSPESEISTVDHEKAIGVRLLPSVSAGIISIDGGPPLFSSGAGIEAYFRMSSPHATQINFDTALIYESQISPHDKRDYNFGHKYQANIDELLPLEYDCRKYAKLDFPDGTRLGIHVVVHITALIEINLRIKHGLNIRLSPAYLYAMRPNRPLYGMCARDALKIGKKSGLASADVYSWEGDDELAPPIGKAILGRASGNTIKEYYRVLSVGSLKNAIRLLGACFILLPLYSGRPCFWCTDSPGKRTSNVQSAIVVGYNTDGFILNIWTNDWIGSRQSIFPFCDWASVIECWAVSLNFAPPPVGLRGSAEVIPALPTGRQLSSPKLPKKDVAREGCCAIQ